MKDKEYINNVYNIN
nr:hypothetical protein [Escherichia coli]